MIDKLKKQIAKTALEKINQMVDQQNSGKPDGEKTPHLEDLAAPTLMVIDIIAEAVAFAVENAELDFTQVKVPTQMGPQTPQGKGGLKWK